MPSHSVHSSVEFWVSTANVTALACILLWQSYKQSRAQISTKQAAPKPEVGEAQRHELQNTQEARKLGNVTEIIDRDGAERIVNIGCCQGALLGLQLPFSTLRVLAMRVDAYRPRTLFAGLPVLLLGFIAMPLAICTGCQPHYVSILLGSVMFTMLIIGVALCLSLQEDSEWRQIESFASHRQARVSTKNGIALATIVATCFQLSALAMQLFRPEKPQSASDSSYEQTKVQLQQVFSMCLFDVGPLKNSAFKLLKHTYFVQLVNWCPVVGGTVCAILWWLLYGGIFHKLISFATPVSIRADWMERARAQTMQLGLRNGVYQSIASRSTYTTIFLLLSDTLSVTIVSGLVKAMDCSPDSQGVMHLGIDQDILCFVGVHGWVSILIVSLLIFFLSTVVFTAPFVIADSGGIFLSENLDIRYEPLFYAQERLCKLTMAVTTLYFDHDYAFVCRNVNLSATVWMAYTTRTRQPCSIIWINVARSATYEVAAVVYLAVLFDAVTTIEWWPLLAMSIGVVVVALNMACRLRKTFSSPVPEFVYSTAIGTLPIMEDKALDAHEAWDDVSLLRGLHHRLCSVSIWASHYVLGVQCTYQVDGAFLIGPRHVCTPSEIEDPDMVLAGAPTTVITLASDEFLVALDGDPDGVESGVRGKWGVAFATSKGKQYPVTTECGHYTSPDDPKDWLVSAEPGEVVGLFGAGGGHLNTIGFIKLASLPQASAEPYHLLP